MIEMIHKLRLKGEFCRLPVTNPTQIHAIIGSIGGNAEFKEPDQAAVDCHEGACPIQKNSFSRLSISGQFQTISAFIKCSHNG
jgi:hypothetical protein